MTVSLSPGRSTVTAAPTLGSRAIRSRGRVEGILWVTREGVGESNVGDPVLGVKGKGSLSPHSPDAEKLGHRVEHHLLL